MSRTFHGGNSIANRAISGRQRGDPEYGAVTPIESSKVHPALPILEGINTTMTKGVILEKVDQAMKKLGG
jgi:hypothetical protein